MSKIPCERTDQRHFLPWDVQTDRRQGAVAGEQEDFLEHPDHVSG